MNTTHFLLFPNFKPKALTFSYDDGVDHDIRLVKIFTKNGLVGTFNINSEFQDRVGRLSVDKARELFAGDMEIGVHGAAHRTLAKHPIDVARREILVDKQNHERNYAREIRGMAYANGSYNDEVIEMIKSLGIVYARTTVSTNSFDLPENWLALHPTCRHKAENLEELTNRFIAPIDENDQTAKPMLFYLWGHSYEFENDGNWELIESFCALMARQTDIWFATNIDIYDYVAAFEALVFASDLSSVENQSETDVYLKVNGKKVIATAKATTKL